MFKESIKKSKSLLYLCHPVPQTLNLITDVCVCEGVKL